MVRLSRFLALAATCQNVTAMTLINGKQIHRFFTECGILPPLTRSESSLVFPNETQSTIPYSEYTGRQIPVTYTNDPKSVYRWFSDNLPHTGCTIGFDVEAVPDLPWMKYTLFDGPATVQLATPDSCLVVHLVRGSGRHSQACAPILKAIICDEQFIKAGCALDDDVLELYDLWNGLDAKSRLDLGGIGGIKNNKRRGLKTLSKHILGVHLPKPKAQTLSDWSQVPLTEHQVSYSARDAWAGAAIANKLAEYDPETFGHGNLVELLLKQETPVSQLADRMERHKRAKQDLGALLKPYPKSRYHGQNIPNRVQSRAQQLRDVIKNSKSFERPLVFEVDHLGIDLDSNM